MSEETSCTSPLPYHPVDDRERDACALICAVRKGGQATHGNVKRTIEALTRMGHRTGIVDGEGDGVGIMTDIPRQIWARQLTQHGLRSSLAIDPNFWVAHLMIPARDRSRAESLVDQICRQIQDAGLDLLDPPRQRLLALVEPVDVGGAAGEDDRVVGTCADELAHLGAGHGLAHGGRGLGDGVAAKVDGFHGGKSTLTPALSGDGPRFMRLGSVPGFQ